MSIGQDVDIVVRPVPAARSDAINIHEAKTHLSRPIEPAAAGNEIVIAKASDGFSRWLAL